MKTEILDLVTEQTKALIAAPSCGKEAKEAAEAWLAAVGTPGEAAETAKYLKVLEESIMPIDGLISFADSEMGTKIFGAEMAKNILAHGKEIKAKGAKFCDCPACAACEAILALKDKML